MVVEREDDVGDLDLSDGFSIALAVRLDSRRAICTRTDWLPLQLLRELLFDFFDQVVFEAHGGADLVFEISARPLILTLFPSQVVALVNLQLNSVIAGCDRGHVPLELPNLISLVEVPQRDGEKIRDQAADCDCRGNLEVLMVKIALFLDASVLRIEERVI